MSAAYTLLTSEAAYREACDTVLALAERQILIFDHDLVRLRVHDRSHTEALADFLEADSLRRIRVVLHDPGPLERDMPRLMQLMARFSQAAEVRQSPDDMRHLADTHVLADEKHGVRRFHVDQARSALIVDDPAYIQPWQQRFDELWDLSQPCLRFYTTGL